MICDLAGRCFIYSWGISNVNMTNDRRIWLNPQVYCRIAPSDSFPMGCLSIKLFRPWECVLCLRKGAAHLRIVYSAIRLNFRRLRFLDFPNSKSNWMKWIYQVRILTVIGDNKISFLSLNNHMQSLDLFQKLTEMQVCRDCSRHSSWSSFATLNAEAWSIFHHLRLDQGQELAFSSS
jgi:hypothetical protein